MCFVLCFLEAEFERVLEMQDVYWRRKQDLVEGEENLLCRSHTGPANLVGSSGVIGHDLKLVLLLCSVTGGGQSQDSHALALDCSLQLRCSPGN